MMPLRIGTRGSDLALWQARRVKSLLGARGFAAEFVIIRTTGDEENRYTPGNEPVKNLFTKEIERALLERRVDLAVHSLKDLEAVVTDGLHFAAFPERNDPRDALVSRDGMPLEDLASGAVIGTSSLRRRAALLALRPDLQVVTLRGNVPTRLRRVEEGKVDATVLAMAGLNRLELADGAVPFDPAEFVPAPGQGALAIQVRSEDETTTAAVAPLDDGEVRTAVVAETAALARLEGGCQVPVGALCRADDGRRVLHVRVYAPDGSDLLETVLPVDVEAPEAAGVRAAEELLDKGAAALMRSDEAANLKSSGEQ
jgi:hydroxymethylbilane synthase